MPYVHSTLVRLVAVAVADVNCAKAMINRIRLRHNAFDTHSSENLWHTLHIVGRAMVYQYILLLSFTGPFVSSTLK